MNRHNLQDSSNVSDFFNFLCPISESFLLMENAEFFQTETQSVSVTTCILLKLKSSLYARVCVCFSNWPSPLCDRRFLRAAGWPGDLIGWWRAHGDCWLMVVRGHEEEREIGGGKGRERGKERGSGLGGRFACLHDRHSGGVTRGGREGGLYRT